MKITLFTYVLPYRKTYDIPSLLKTRGYEDVPVIAVPLSYVKKKYLLVFHRPPMD